MTARSTEVLAATGLRNKMKTSDLIVAVRAMVAAGRKNKLLRKPCPALDRLSKAVGALDAAEVAAKSRAVGTVPVRDAARREVFRAAAQYKSAVQTLANADPVNARPIIVESGLRIRRESRRRKAPFSVKRGRVARSLEAEVRAAAKRASYEWEVSVDGGKTWKLVRTTLPTKTVIDDLPIGVYVQVRCRPLTKSGRGEWIGPITVLVT